jgi:hypothetical protein
MVGVLSASAALLTALANGNRPDRFVPEVATPPISGTAIPDASWPAAVSVPIAAPLPAGTAESVVEPAPVVEGLVLTLTALSDCWVRTTIDGGEPRERLLRPNESITLRASGEAVLRIGDPAALALQITAARRRPWASQAAWSPRASRHRTTWICCPATEAPAWTAGHPPPAC